ncbi:MAG TPA: GNAT family N-acetyltransferase [Clostridia bacterium]|jgi:RimJ/RimL family protein N-acetyltransferase|nr:MAG: putative acetyltransferase YhhY [Firmicutes bacterium ADurb.Bin248]HOF99929.1 GNAT family N-acetyltransferase [Clostridia bacterium]HOS17770.1 GNAT family N-acetyltransferase [Clostridia bacterium]HPK14426.1 GNAT family N-acetyltransferase [Clostridia bacterium]
MLFEQKTIPLKNGALCTLRSPAAADAAEMIECLRNCCAQTPHLLREPEECAETPEQEARYLEGINASENHVMIVALVGGRIAGNCQIERHRRMKTRHRASVGISLLREYWNLGIGTAMFGEMLDIARQWGIMQLELEVIEGNARARALYEKLGFRLAAIHPGGIRLRDGRLLDEYLMIRRM